MDNKLRIASYFLAVIGMIDSFYLTWVDLTHQQAYCGGSGDCQTVANSPYAEIYGIPIALLGLGAYVVIAALLYLERRGAFWNNNSPLVIFGVTLAGTVYSVYLTYLELWVIRAICPYCVVSAIVMTLLFVIAIVRLVRGNSESSFKKVHSGG